MLFRSPPGERVPPDFNRGVGEGAGESDARKMKDLARKLRKNQTETEARLWAQLRDRRLKGFKFRRQHPIGRYIVDFYCPEKRLVIELDGGGHAEDEQKQSDKKRDEWLKQKGISVFRFWNNIVWDNLEGVLKTILKALDGETPHP